MVKQSLKQKIIQAIFMGLMYASMMILFDVFSGYGFHLWKFVFHAVFFGGTMGFIIPLITEYFGKKDLDKITIILSDDEQLKMESIANFNSDAGKIILTDKRLIFKAKESKNNTIEIPLDEITEIKKQTSLGIVNNIFKVKTSSKEYKFIVYENERDTWVSLLTVEKSYFV